MEKDAKKSPVPAIEKNVHRRTLSFLNNAKRPHDLAVLPRNEVQVLLDPEHRRKRPFRHDPLVRPPGDELCSRQIAERVLDLRDTRFPRGFASVHDLQTLLHDAWQDFLRRLLEWFRGRNYGSWSEPYELEDDDGHLSVVHAAVLNTGDVLMIEHACHDGISKTPLWDPNTRTLNPPPTPPTEGLYCSGHCFLSDGKLLVVGGRGDAGDWPNDKDIAWLYDPSTNSWDVTRDKSSTATPKPREKMHHDRWYPTLVNLGVIAST